MKNAHAAALAAAVLAGTSVTGVAVASSANSSEIRACVAKKTGTYQRIPHLAGDVRIATRCFNWERRTTWSQVGPQGPTGPQGATGAQGATGPQGAAGTTSSASTYARTWNLSSPGSSQSWTEVYDTVTIPAGARFHIDAPTFNSAQRADCNPRVTIAFLTIDGNNKEIANNTVAFASEIVVPQAGRLIYNVTCQTAGPVPAFTGTVTLS